MSSRVVVALRVAVPRPRAFDVFVNHIGEWWQPNGLFRTGPRKPGVLRFHGGPEGTLVEINADGESWELGRVLHWEPPARLVFTWRQPDFPEDLRTEVDVRFDAVDEQVTRVCVEHRGFHAIQADSAARHGFPDAALQMRLAEWWQRLLGNLAARSATPP